MNIRIGLNSFVVAPLKEDISAAQAADGIAKVTYGEIKRFPDIQNIDYSPRIQTADVDADDETTTINKTSGADGSVQRTMFTPEELAEILDGTILEDGTVLSSEDDEPGEYAIGVKIPVFGGQTLLLWILRAKFSQGDFAAETKGNDKLNPQSDKISFKSHKRKCDKMWKITKLISSEEEEGDFFTVEKISQIYKKKKKSDTSGGGADTPSSGEEVTGE